MSEYKTNYFGSFLDAMRSSPSTAVGGPAGATLGASAFPVHAPALGVADNVLVSLNDLGGEASFQELLPASGQSVDALAGAVSKLQVMELATTTGTRVKITGPGRAQAIKLRSL